MEFKEFSEFSNPESKDYDITSSYISEPNHDYVLDLYELIGLLEDVTEEELQNVYGITMEEYYKPNADTIRKVKEKLNNKQDMSRR